MKIMAQVRDCPTLFNFLGMVKQKNRLQMVMEYMPQGTLAGYLTNTPNISGKQIWLLLMDIIYALLYLHAKGKVHRDIKSINVLINNNRAYLCDFGIVSENSVTTKVIGTSDYIDPSLEFDKNVNDGKGNYTKMSDIYSLGILILGMLTKPYQEFIIGKSKFPDNIPKQLKDFLPTLLDRRLNKRPNIGIVFKKVFECKDDFEKNDPDFLSTTVTKKEPLKPTQNISTSFDEQKIKMTEQSTVEMPFYDIKFMHKDVLTWYIQAEYQNLANAQYKLGLSYEYGKGGLNSNMQQAFYWYNKAAEQDNTDAQNALGSYYEEGKGFYKDEKQALTWYRKAKKDFSLNLSWRGELYEYELIEWIEKSIDITQLDLSYCKNVTYEVVETLEKLPSLISLKLGGLRLYDTSIKILKKLSGLKHLDISGNHFTIDGLAILLKKLTGLISLNLQGCEQLNDSFGKNLGKLTSLTSLNISGRFNVDHKLKNDDDSESDEDDEILNNPNKLTDAFLTYLENLTGLISLDISGRNRFTDIGLNNLLKKLPNLKNLNVSYCDNFTDAGFESLSESSALISVDASYCKNLTHVFGKY